MSEQEHSLRLTRIVRAERPKVFAAWTEAEHLRRWSCPEGATVEEAEVDLVVGGRYRISMRTADGSLVTASGVYREIEPPRRLAYTWDWEQGAHRMDRDTLVTVLFEERDGATEVTLTHERLPDVAATDGHRVGWESCLNRLEPVLDTASMASS